MSQFLDDLLKSGTFLQNQINQLQISRTMEQANETVSAIKTNVQDEMEQRKQLQTLSNALVSDLARFGAPAQTIQMLAQSYGPQPLEDANTLLAQGVILDDQDSLEKGRSLQMEMMRPQMLMAQAKSGGGGDPLSDKSLESINELDAQSEALTDLLGKAAKNPNLLGPGASRIPFRSKFDPEYADFESQVGRFYDSYRKAITGAGAAGIELEKLEKNIPMVSDRPEVFKKKVQTMLRIGDKVKRRYLVNQQKSGRDIKGFQADVDKIEQEQGLSEGSGFDLKQFITPQPVFKRR
jgi:hypothetical protein